MRTFRPLIALLPLLFTACDKNPEPPSTDAAPGAAAAPAAKPYPLTTCLVSGEELDSMGDPVVIIHQGREIKFCCDKCVPKFRQDPAKYLAKLAAAAAPAVDQGSDKP